ncbi:MAG: GCN5-related N-acetyltransferase [Actinomycetia bacterium]|nr:GCN5-related N-acetyltransferase [Actinomycetes bacterium]
MTAATQSHDRGTGCGETLRRRDLPDGATVMVRPICAEDVERLRRMFGRLSPTTVYRRFFSPIPSPSEGALRHLATVDHERRDALVALIDDEIVGVARYDASAGAMRAEIAVTVEDAWQHRGLGTVLLRMLTKLALDRGLNAFFASMLADNRPALAALHRLAPGARVALEGGAYEATIKLAP